MRHVWWLIPSVTVLVAVRIWWTGPADVIVLITLVGGLAVLVYLAMRTGVSMPPSRNEQEPDKRDVQRDIPPSPG